MGKLMGKLIKQMVDSGALKKVAEEKKLPIQQIAKKAKDKPKDNIADLTTDTNVEPIETDTILKPRKKKKKENTIVPLDGEGTSLLS